MTNGKKEEKVMSKTSIGGEPSTSEDVSGGVQKASSSKFSRLRRRGDYSSSSEKSSGDESEDKKQRRKDGGPFKGISRMLRSQARIIVSQNRRRIRTDGFDLDLTYITDRIIAMGYPANATEALYRNSMKHIIRFLEKRHRDHYKVFNLRGQYSYDPANFKNRVISFEMTDHHPPRLELMAPFCREVHEWLQEDARNVVAVHCKAGKGRTGVMICAYLSYCMFYPSPRQNMDYYSVVRTRNNKGVTIPSQRRYVYYYDHLRKHQLNYLPLRVQLMGIYVERLPTKNGALLKEKLCMSVANGDVDVFFGDPIAISEDAWSEEEAAWAGHVVSNGPDSLDPNDPEQGKDVISRRAYGWTIPITKPVFLEGDVRVNLYVNKKFINLFSLEQRNKLGHVWFNTMFSCPGACGDDPYIHGDEAHPYPEGETTIAERKNKFHIGGEDENVPCSSSIFSPPPHDDPIDDQAPCSSTATTIPLMKKTSQSGSVQSEGRPPQTHRLASGSQQSKSQPLLSPDRSPASSFGGRGSPTENSTKMRRDPTRKSMSKLSKAGKAAKRFFSTSEGAKARASEPAIHSRSATSTPRRSNPETFFSSTIPNRPPINFDELQIAEPPGLARHCADESLQRIYHDKGRQPPRFAINRMLAEAHEKDIVQDVYNERRRSVPSEGEPVKCAPDGRPFASGPNRIVRNADEHVAVYPVMEIDRAFKNAGINNGFKMFIVTKCIEPKTYRHGEAFMNVTYEKQKKINDEVFHKSQSKKSYVDLEPKLAEYGAGKTWPPVIQYGNVGMQGSGGEATSLSDEVFKEDPRARDDRYCRYFYKQRRDSVSRYPNSSHTCPATGFCMDGSMRSERLNTGTTIASERGGRSERSLTPIDASVGLDEVCGVAEGDEMDDVAVDMDVRSYHPNSAGQWDQSASSRSSSSSEDIQNQQTSYVMSTDYSGVESSVNELNMTPDSQHTEKPE